MSPIFRKISNSTGSYHLTRADRGKILIVENRLTRQKSIALADDIISAHEHTNTWQNKGHWNGKGTDKQFTAV